MGGKKLNRTQITMKIRRAVGTRWEWFLGWANEMNAPYLGKHACGVQTETGRSGGRSLPNEKPV